MSTNLIGDIKKNISGEQGIITLDFIFAFTLVMGMTIIFLGLTLSLTVSEVVQYISFSAARSYMASNFNRDAQYQEAEQKYQNLISDPAVKTLFSGSWFSIDGKLSPGKDVGNFNSVYNPSDDDRSNTFEGVRLSFDAKVLQYNLPLFGSTYTNGDGFTCFIGSYLMREPTQSECEAFNKQRYARLLNLQDSTGQIYAGGTAKAWVGYFVISDNGC